MNEFMRKALLKKTIKHTHTLIYDLSVAKIKFNLKFPSKAYSHTIFYARYCDKKIFFNQYLISCAN